MMIILIDRLFTFNFKICEKTGYKYLDFGATFEESNKLTDLIYDRHWNSHGREKVASVITEYVKKNASK